MALNKTSKEVKHVESSDKASAVAQNDGSIIFLKESGVSSGKIVKDGVDYSADYLDADVTTTAAVGNIPAGSVLPKGKNVQDVLKDIMNYKAPSIKTLNMTFGGTVISANTNIFVSGTSKSLSVVKHAENNTENIKSLSLALSDNGTVTTVVPTKASTDTDVISLFGGAKSIDVSVAKTVTITLSGLNSLGSAMASKTITVNVVRPLYTFMSTSEASIASDFATKAVAETTPYNGTATIKKAVTANAGQCWCVALPSSMTCSAIGTSGDFGFSAQQTSGFTTVQKTGVQYDGAAPDTYTIYYVKLDTAQSALEMRIDIKLK